MGSLGSVIEMITLQVTSIITHPSDISTGHFKWVEKAWDAVDLTMP